MQRNRPRFASRVFNLSLNPDEYEELDEELSELEEVEQAEEQGGKEGEGEREEDGKGLASLSFVIDLTSEGDSDQESEIGIEAGIEGDIEYDAESEVSSGTESEPDLPSASRSTTQRSLSESDAEPSVDLEAGTMDSNTIDRLRADSISRLAVAWNDIFLKYGKPVEELPPDDVFDLWSGTLIVDNGVLKSKPRVLFGALSTREPDDLFATKRTRVSPESETGEDDDAHDQDPFNHWHDDRNRRRPLQTEDKDYGRNGLMSIPKASPNEFLGSPSPLRQHQGRLCHEDLRATTKYPQGSSKDYDHEPWEQRPLSFAKKLEGRYSGEGEEDEDKVCSEMEGGGQEGYAGGEITDEEITDEEITDEEITDEEITDKRDYPVVEIASEDIYSEEEIEEENYSEEEIENKENYSEQEIEDEGNYSEEETEDEEKCSDEGIEEKNYLAEEIDKDYLEEVDEDEENYSEEENSYHTEADYLPDETSPSETHDQWVHQLPNTAPGSLVRREEGLDEKDEYNNYPEDFDHLWPLDDVSRQHSEAHSPWEHLAATNRIEWTTEGEGNRSSSIMTTPSKRKLKEDGHARSWFSPSWKNLVPPAAYLAETGSEIEEEEGSDDYDEEDDFVPQQRYNPHPATPQRLKASFRLGKKLMRESVPPFTRSEPPVHMMRACTRALRDSLILRTPLPYAVVPSSPTLSSTPPPTSLVSAQPPPSKRQRSECKFDHSPKEGHNNIKQT
ncbi:hypothetical protein BGZ58_009714 [Dissophora ornata]|nr:hypothetical protein BGZ58_009714 [Dissophora ornata]